MSRPIGTTSALSSSKEPARFKDCVPQMTRDEIILNKAISYPKKQRPSEKSFFDLPPEIRNTIYNLWFTRKSAVLSLRVSRALVPNSGPQTSSGNTSQSVLSDTESNTRRAHPACANWTTGEPKLSWHINWDRTSVPMPLGNQVLRVCKLMNAEGNAILFSGETAIDLRDPIGTSSVDRLHQYITNPICRRPLQWTRHIKLSLFPELSEEKGRTDFAATVDAATKVLDGGSRLKSLVINIHVSDRPARKYIKRSIMRLQGLRINGRVTIKQFVYGNEKTVGVWVPPLRSGWARKLLKRMKGKHRFLSFVEVASSLSGGEEVPGYTIYVIPCEHFFGRPCYHPIRRPQCEGWKKILAVDTRSL